jgi:regulatory protein
MPVITSIARRRDGVVAVTVDGEPDSHVVPLELVIEHGLHEGAQFAADDWVRIRRQAGQRLAVRRALELLARKHRTEAELHSALGRRFHADEVAHAVARMRELGYLDDHAWASTYVASGRSQLRGAALLRQELTQHGVPGDMAARVLEEHDDLEAALAAARRRLTALGRLDEQQIRRRLYDFLRRRGFDHSIARVVLERLVAP